MVSLVLLRLEPVGKKLFNVKFIFGVCIRQVSVIFVLCDIKLFGQKRPHAAKLQDALGAVQHGKLIHRSEVFAKLLVVEAVRNLAPTALAGVEGVDGLFPKRLIQLFQRGRLLAAKENRGVAIPDDCSPHSP